MRSARKESRANPVCGIAVSSVALAAKPCYPYSSLESSLRSFRTEWLKTIRLKKFAGIYIPFHVLPRSQPCH